jgi:biotin synthase
MSSESDRQSSHSSMVLDHEVLVVWLRELDVTRLKFLWRAADGCRREHVGDDVHLRGLIEVSNHCARLCGYCGIRAANTNLERYRLTRDEIMASVKLAVNLGYGTVVLQAGEDDGITQEWMAEIVRSIKGETPLAVTLSLGERTRDELEAWRNAGADRYLLRIETSNSALFARIHPPRTGSGVGATSRTDLLRQLREMGYEIGSGSLIGIPGQSYDDLARDLELFASLDLDMIGVGPFIPHPQTPLGSLPGQLTPDEQVPNTELMTYKTVALARLLCPNTNIPSTTALATLNLTAGRELGLQRGGNVIMPNLTPEKYRPLYEIYPAKACLRETPEQCHECVRKRIEAIGRRIGSGPGTSRSMLDRQSR